MQSFKEDDLIVPPVKQRRKQEVVRFGKEIIKVKLDKWTQGYACACAVLAQVDGRSAGLSLMGEGGFNLRKFIAAGIDDYDLEKLTDTKAKSI